jgi:2,4-dienoyl-CoA reductase-like NADH-dependent reductase (Old Yellow Enzyme family)
MPGVLDPLTLRGVTLRNRIGISPMCQFSSEDGHATDWHVVHLGSRAQGGAGLVYVEATAVEARGRISPADMGIWQDSHIEPLARVAKFVKAHGAVPAIQIAHAGRKGSTAAPWEGGGSLTDAEGGYETVAPSALAFGGAISRVPRPLAAEEIGGIVAAFGHAAERALAAGFEWIEFHAAHGYLAHEFLSPLSNTRNDEYGGSFDNRIRFCLEATRAIRRAWHERLPMAIRVSCTDWLPDGWDLEQTIALAKQLKAEGVDIVDCSSSGLRADQQPARGPGFQVPFAEAVRKGAGVPTAAVGGIVAPSHADEIVRNGRADLVLVGRQSLRDPFFVRNAAMALGAGDKARLPIQYHHYVGAG